MSEPRNEDQVNENQVNEKQVNENQENENLENEEIRNQNLQKEEPVSDDAADDAADDATDEAVKAVEEEPVEEPEVSREDQLALERDEFRDKWMRAVAETDNVRKRSRREVQDARRFAQAETLRSFLDVYDNCERALQSMNVDKDDEQGQSVRQGVELIFQRFQNALKERGAGLIEVDGCEFDPSVHEAVGSMAREGVEAGHVIEVVQQGFKFGDMVLRPARVVVSS